MTRLDQLIKRLQRLSGENPVAYVKLLPEEWPEIAGIIEDALRMGWLRQNALPGYSQSGTAWSIHCSVGNMSTWPALTEAIDKARTTTKETKE